VLLPLLESFFLAYSLAPFFLAISPHLKVLLSIVEEEAEVSGGQGVVGSNPASSTESNKRVKVADYGPERLQVVLTLL
jgi:hypothetical protein